MNKEEVNADSIWNSYVPIVTTAKPEGGFHSVVHITDEISEPREYLELLTVLNSATEEDTIIFNINCPGGRLDTTLMVVDAMHNTLANTIARITGEAASAATMIMLAVDNLECSDFGSAMVHYYSGGLYGKGNELKSRMDFEVKHMPRIVQSYYKGFLTKKEIKALIGGEDFYMDKEEIEARWEVVIDKRTKLALKAMSEEEEQGHLELLEYLETKGYTFSKQ